MRHENSVFHGLLQQVPWGEFDRLVAQHGTDRRVRRLSSRSQLVALLYGQLAGAQSLREIEAGLASHAARLYHLGARPVRRATLADALARRPAEALCGLFAALVARTGRGLRRYLGEAVLLVDATTLPLPGRGADWARGATACGAKLHVIYDATTEQPTYHAVTPARTNDITAAQAMPIQPGATYVFDLGYYDYAWWARLDAAGCRIVTRLKRNTRLHDTCDRPLPPDSGLLLDRTGHLPARQASRRANPLARLVREIQLNTPTGRTLRLLTNDLDSPAQAIADLYKRRWAIELFFRWTKQTLRIRHLLGTSQNALRAQLAAALIAYLLLRTAHAAQRAIPSPLTFARLVCTNLMHRRPLNTLLLPHSPPPPDPRQLHLAWVAP